MKKLLSQEEIDALLSNVSPTEARVTETVSPTRRPVQLYDFKHPERISKDQIRTLRTIHDSLARMLATYFSTTLRTLVDVNFSSIDQVTFNEYMMSLSVPNALYILNMEKLDGKAIIEISPQFLLFAVDRLLGGLGDTEFESREITVIEQNVVARIIQQMLIRLNEVWSQVYSIGATVEGFESDPQFVQIARSSEALAIIFFEIHVRGATFTMNIAIPYYALEPILTKLSLQSMMAITGRVEEKHTGDEIARRLEATRLPIRVLLAETNVKIRDLIELKKDDLLQLDQRTNAELPVLISEKLKFFGTAGRIGRRRAVKLLHPSTPVEVLIHER